MNLRYNDVNLFYSTPYDYVQVVHFMDIQWPVRYDDMLQYKFYHMNMSQGIILVDRILKDMLEMYPLNLIHTLRGLHSTGFYMIMIRIHHLQFDGADKVNPIS